MKVLYKTGMDPTIISLVFEYVSFRDFISLRQVSRGVRTAITQDHILKHFFVLRRIPAEHILMAPRARKRERRSVAIFRGIVAEMILRNSFPDLSRQRKFVFLVIKKMYGSIFDKLDDRIEAIEDLGKGSASELDVLNFLIYRCDYMLDLLERPYIQVRIWEKNRCIPTCPKCDIRPKVCAGCNGKIVCGCDSHPCRGCYGRMKAYCFDCARQSQVYTFARYEEENSCRWCRKCLKCEFRPQQCQICEKTSCKCDGHYCSQYDVVRCFGCVSVYETTDEKVFCSSCGGELQT